MGQTVQAAGIDRRRFLARSAQVAGGAILGGGLFQGLVARAASAQATGSPAASDGYGPLATRRAENTGEPYLALPPDFRYTVFGRTGSPMSDLRPTPPLHDGMAAFAGPGSGIRLVRNHEVPSTGPALALPAYDPLAQGGTTTLVVDPRSRLPRRAFLSLAGTSTNCAGGPTPWGSWLTCEETTAGASRGYTRPHGYVFEVRSRANGPVDPDPLTAMGRFEHEAVTVDPDGVIVYQTEDEGSAGFYRFVPDLPGVLAAGGSLQMLAVAGQPNYDTRTGQTVGEPLTATWVDILYPDPAAAEADPGAVFQQGYAAGGAVFSRLEGAFRGLDRVYFHSTDGGDSRLGQVWEYVPSDPSNGGQPTLRLIFESTDPAVLDHPDNLCVSPRGGLVICEDGGDGDNYVRGLTPEGAIFDFARNEVPGFESTEFAGSCFSPDGQTLFVNIQVPGLTFAIWGPWERGAL
jgi:secreted PhoX family phosphatase